MQPSLSDDPESSDQRPAPTTHDNSAMESSEPPSYTSATANHRPSASSVEGIDALPSYEEAVELTPVNKDTLPYDPVCKCLCETVQI